MSPALQYAGRALMSAAKGRLGIWRRDGFVYDDFANCLDAPSIVPAGFHSSKNADRMPVDIHVLQRD